VEPIGGKMLSTRSPTKVFKEKVSSSTKRVCKVTVKETEKKRQRLLDSDDDFVA
jgi:hypothetical protein